MDVYGALMEFLWWRVDGKEKLPTCWREFLYY